MKPRIGYKSGLSKGQNERSVAVSRSRSADSRTRLSIGMRMKTSRYSEVTRRNLLKAPSLLLANPLVAARTEGAVSRNPFSLPGAANILTESDFGIVNGAITAGTPYRSVLALNGLYAPPYASSDFVLEMWLFGERVVTRDYEWFPTEVRRTGALHGIEVSSSTVLAAGRRGLVIAVTLKNLGQRVRRVPLQFKITGSLDYVHTWDFGRPDTTKKVTESVGSPSRVVRRNDAGALVNANRHPEPEMGTLVFSLGHPNDARARCATNLLCRGGNRKIPKSPKQFVATCCTIPPK